MIIVLPTVPGTVLGQTQGQSMSILFAPMCTLSVVADAQPAPAPAESIGRPSTLFQAGPPERRRRHPSGKSLARFARPVAPVPKGTKVASVAPTSGTDSDSDVSTCRTSSKIIESHAHGPMRLPRNRKGHGNPRIHVLYG